MATTESAEAAEEKALEELGALVQRKAEADKKLAGVPLESMLAGMEVSGWYMSSQAHCRYALTNVNTPMLTTVLSRGGEGGNSGSTIAPLESGEYVAGRTWAATLSIIGRCMWWASVHEKHAFPTESWLPSNPWSLWKSTQKTKCFNSLHRVSVD